MPSINRKQSNPNKVPYKHQDNSSRFYNSKAWHSLRDMYIREHPICEMCERWDHVEAAQEIHHVTPFLTAQSETGKWQLLLDPNNLMSLCSCCHHAIHNKARAHCLRRVDYLSRHEWEEAHDILKTGHPDDSLS